jgi:hypothetical protein
MKKFVLVGVEWAFNTVTSSILPQGGGERLKELIYHAYNNAMFLNFKKILC